MSVTSQGQPGPSPATQPAGLCFGRRYKQEKGDTGRKREVQERETEVYRVQRRNEAQM